MAPDFSSRMDIARPRFFGPQKPRYTAGLLYLLYTSLHWTHGRILKFLFIIPLPEVQAQATEIIEFRNI